MATVQLLCGAARSERVRHVDGLMRRYWGRARLLVPAREYDRRRTEHLILEAGLEGAWGRPVWAFNDFVAHLLRADAVDATRIDSIEQRFVFERIVTRMRQQGALDAVGEAADTDGFISHVMRVIADLKQAAVEPATFRDRVAQREDPSPLDHVVAEIYAAYQDELLTTGVYDLQGLFWKADLLCRQGRPVGLANINALFLDGFDDFTPSEFRLIQALEQHVELLVLGLNYDTDGDRRDLYEIPARTAGRIREQFDVPGRVFVGRVFEEEPPTTFTQFAAHHVFWRNRPPRQAGLRADLEILPCADSTQEAETIGRRVKALLLDEGVPTNEIAIVYRDLGEAASTLRSVFAEFGVPVRVQQKPALTESAVGAFLLNLLDATAVWERDTVVGVLMAPWFCPDGVCAREHAAAYPLLSRMAQVIAGHDEWVARLESFVERLAKGAGEDVKRLLARMPDASTAAEALLADVRRLNDLGTALPAEAPPAAFARGLDALIDEVGIAGALDAYRTEEKDAKRVIYEAEKSALEAVQGLLVTLVRWYGQDMTPESRTAFVSRLHQALESSNYEWPHPEKGVACLDVASIRWRQYDYVFFAGVSEGNVPCPPPTNAVYSEKDLDGLRRVGIDMAGKRLHSAGERLLFHHVLTVAKKHLCISWHARSRGGKERLPSPYIADLLELFPGEAVERPMPPAGAFVPTPARVASWRDLANVAFAAPSQTLRDALPERFATARSAIEIEKARHDASAFGVHDGVLIHPERVTSTAARFDDAHVFSVAQIETYLACPFRFFVERVLDIETAEVPVAEFDARVRGTILHAILEAFHAQFRGRAVPEIPEQEANEAMAAATVGQFGANAWRSATAPRGVLAVEQERLRVILDRYLSIERDRDERAWKPEHFEVAFGAAHGTSGDPLTRDDSFALETPGGSVRFSGRIDRVDLDAGHARIVDYKTSVHLRPKDLDEGRSIQLAVYALALEGLLMPDTTCAEAYFIEPGREKRVEALGRTDAKKPVWAERQAAAKAAVARAVAAVRAGWFPPTPDGENPCAYCPAGNACRHEQARIERKEKAARG